MGTGDNVKYMLGVICDGLASNPGGEAILLVASCYRNRDKLRQCRPVWPECGFNYNRNGKRHSCALSAAPRATIPFLLLPCDLRPYHNNLKIRHLRW